MRIENLTKEELENYSYDDLAYMILKQEGHKMKIHDLFSRICKLLDLNEKAYEDKIADFFQLLSTEKRFLMLEDGYWDLRDNHSKKVIIDEDEEDFVEVIDDETEEDEDEEEDIFNDESNDDDIIEDDLKDLAVIDPEDEENDNLE